MPYHNKKANYTAFILLFVLIRIILNVFALPHYGFQRDEMLHLALGDHLDWGFKEVPPFIAFIAKIQMMLFGSSIPATRIFTTLCSGLLVLITGLLTVELGGRRYAIAIACLTLTFSPAFMASGYLFQPVIFDQLWWVLSAYLLVKYFNSAQAKYLYYLGIAIGLGMLTKYTMAFFTAALVISILLTSGRTIFATRAIWVSVVIAVLIFLPNIIWQLTHHFPLATHMRKLRSSQLDYVKPGDFMIQQLLVNAGGLWVWLVGLGFLLFSSKVEKYRFLAFAYLFTLALFLILNGKIYYLFGAYPMLFAAGGLGIEYLISIPNKVWRTVALLFFILPNFVFLPLALPVVPINQALPLFSFIDHQLKIDFPFKWEDQKHHFTTQDYGDMFGWDELGEKVTKTWLGLTREQQQQTIIFADNYGEAGAIHHYCRQYNMPDVISLNSSFSLWAPDSLKAKYIIYINSKWNNNAIRLYKLGCIGSFREMGRIDNPLAVEKGTEVMLFTDIKPKLNAVYREDLLQRRQE